MSFLGVQIVIDESIAFRILPDSFSPSINQMDTGVIRMKPGQRKVNRIWKREVPSFSPTTFHEDLPFFIDHDKNAEVYLYLYDPTLTGEEEIQRVRNLILPGKRLYSYPMPKHRGYTTFVLFYLFREMRRGRHADYTRIFQEIKAFTQNMRFFFIGKTSTPFMNRNRQFTYPSSPRKITKERKLRLFEFEPQKQRYVKRLKSDLTSLWKEVQLMRDEETSLWVVEKGELTTSPSWREIRLSEPDIRWLTLDHEEIPRNIPFLHILFAPRTIDPLLFTE